jgi:hypothetical protein
MWKLTAAWPLLVFAMLTTSPGCRQSREIYSHVDLSHHSFDELINRAPYVVVAISGDKQASGPPGLFARGNGWSPFPAQRYSFVLRIAASLRGDLLANEQISVMSYESLGGLTGPAKGTCGPDGSLGVYFLRKDGSVYRTMVDDYRMWVPLDARTDLALIARNDIPLTIWRLMLYPYEAGLKPPTRADISSIEEVTGVALGRTRVIELLSGIADHSRTLDLQVVACIELNETHRGCGGEGCLKRILANGSALAATGTPAAMIKREMELVAESNESIKLALLDPSCEGIAEWARSKNPTEIRSFLALLTKHPVPGIARLATKRLASGPVCKTRF